jgi:hypothetical protein
MTEDWASQGARLTAEAIKTTIKYLPARNYAITLVHADRVCKPPIPRDYTRAQLLKSVRFLRWKNSENYHVYFRPDAQHFVFVDDVCNEDIQFMIEDGIRPVLVYETSPDNHHAWVQLANRSEQVTEDEALQARVILAERYSGDDDAASKNQPGSLPGLRNVKLMHEDEAGGHPLVKIRRAEWTSPATKLLEEAKARVAASLQVSPLSPGGRVKIEPTNPIDDDYPIEIYDQGRHIVTMSAKYNIGDPETAYCRVLVEMQKSGYSLPIRNSGKGIDRSKQDIALACFLISRGVSNDVVEEVLLHGSDKAAERGMDYVIKTVLAAS